MRERVRIITVIAVVSLALALGATLLPAEAQSRGVSYTWAGSSQDAGADNHSWTDPRNWLPEGVPGDGDSVSIAPPNSTHCTAHVDSVPSGVTLVDFSLSVGTGCGSSVTGGSITVSGTFQWSSGVIDTPMTLASGAAGVVTGTGTGSQMRELTQNLTIDGSVTLESSVVQVENPFVVAIDAGGSLHSVGNSQFTDTACCLNPAHLVNDGTLDVPNGILTVRAVQLDENATTTVASGAVLQATLGPVTAADGATYSGTGRFQIWNGATARFTGTQNLGSGFHLELGNDGTSGDSLGGTATLAGKGEFDWTGGTLMANLAVAHTVTARAEGPNPGNGKRILDGEDSSSGSQVPSSVEVHGALAVGDGATIQTSDEAHVKVASDGQLSLAPGTIVSGTCCVHPSIIENDGGEVQVPVDSDAQGPVNLAGVGYRSSGGTTDIAGGSELQLTLGAASSLSNTTVTGGGRLTLEDPTFASGTVALQGSSTLGIVPGAGSLTGTAHVTGTGVVSWEGGAISGHLTVANTGGLTIAGSTTKTIQPAKGGQPSTLTMDAPVTFTAGLAAGHNVLQAGTATVTLQGASQVAGYAELAGGTLKNTGSLTFAPGAGGIDYLDSGQTLVNTGTVTVASGTVAANGIVSQSAGETLVAGSATLTPSSSHPLTLNGGSLTGTGTVAGPVVNTKGTVDPGSPAGAGPLGTLTVTGGYSQATGGRLALDIGSKGSDVLLVQGAATLKGTLLSHTMAGYTPKVGATRTPVKVGSALTWKVACAITSGQGSGTGHWQPSAGEGSLSVTWKAGKHTSC